MTISGGGAFGRQRLRASHLGRSDLHYGSTPPGSSYTSAPAVTIAPPASRTGCTSQTATATAVVTGGQVSGFIITNGGTGVYFRPDGRIERRRGSGAAATATISTGSVSAITLTNSGAGYSATPSAPTSPSACLARYLRGCQRFRQRRRHYRRDHHQRRHPGYGTATSVPVTIVSASGSGATIANASVSGGSSGDRDHHPVLPRVR